MSIPSQVKLDRGAFISVTNLDGETVKVKVKLVPVRHVEQYIELRPDLTSFVEFVVKEAEGKEKGSFSDSFDIEELEKIDALAKQINDPTITRWIERQAAVVEEMKPLVQKVSELKKSSQTE